MVWTCGVIDSRTAEVMVVRLLDFSGVEACKLIT